MDVEGHERPILESTNWREHGIRACVFEHKHMRAEEIAAIESILGEQGFALKYYGRDAVAFR
jgi:hypothetical protein